MSEPPRKPSADEALMELLVVQDLEDLAAMPEAEREAEMAALGHHRARTHAAITAALREAGIEPPAGLAPAKAAGAGGESKVVDLAAARARRSAPPRTVLLLAAAAAVAVIGKGAVDRGTSWQPLALSYPTHVPGPTAHQLADVVRRDALRLCAKRYYGECLDKLDEAKAIDPPTTRPTSRRHGEISKRRSRSVPSIPDTTSWPSLRSVRWRTPSTEAEDAFALTGLVEGRSTAREAADPDRCLA